MTTCWINKGLGLILDMFTTQTKSDIIIYDLISMVHRSVDISMNPRLDQGDCVPSVSSNSSKDPQARACPSQSIIKISGLTRGDRLVLRGWRALRAFFIHRRWSRTSMPHEKGIWPNYLGVQLAPGQLSSGPFSPMNLMSFIYCMARQRVEG